MKKFLMGLFVMAIATAVSMAGVRIDWTVGGAGFDHTAAENPVAGAFLLDGYSAIWQLIYAGADNAADPIGDPLNPISDVAAWQANNYLRPGGDDQLWAQRTIGIGGGVAPEDLTSWENAMTPAAGVTTFQNLSWNTAGFVYQRVFEGVPGVGSYFFETGLLQLTTTFSAGDGLVPQPFLVDGDAPDYDSASHGFSPHSQVSAVPEPATMGLLGLGALVMAIRRRRS